MTRASSWLPMLAAALMFYFSVPFVQGTVSAQIPIKYDGSTAAKGNPVVAKNGKISRCRQLPEAKDGVMLGVIVPCLIHTIEEDTVIFAGDMVDYFKPLFSALLVFATVLFGVKVLQGERELHGQAITFLLKITIVGTIFFLVPLDSFTMNGKSYSGPVKAMYEMIQDGVGITTAVLDPTAKDPINCDVSKYGYGPGMSTPLLWAQMDCILGKLYGFSVGKDPMTGKKSTNMVLASSAAGLLSGFFFGGTFGVAVFFALLGVLWSLFDLVLRTTMSILNGYLIVCVMLILTPLFAPLLLLKATNDYFEKWWKVMLGGILLPIVISAYSMFALIIYDKILFEPNSLLQNLFNKQMIQEALKQPRKPCDIRVTGDPAFKQAALNANPNASPADLQSEFDKQFKDNPFLHNILPQLSGGNDACGMFKLPVFDVGKVKDKNGKKLEDKFDSNKAIFTELFRNSIKLFVMAYLITQGLKAVEDAISSLTGSSTSYNVLTTKSQTEQNIVSGYKAMQEKMTGEFSNYNEDGTFKNSVRGTDFVKRLPGAVKAGVSAGAGTWLGGVMRK